MRSPPWLLFVVTLSGGCVARAGVPAGPSCRAVPAATLADTQPQTLDVPDLIRELVDDLPAACAPPANCTYIRTFR